MEISTGNNSELKGNKQLSSEKKPSVLLVIEKDSLRDTIIEVLGDFVRIKLAKNITFAREILAGFSPNLIVIDDSLSIDTSFSLSKWIKKDPLLKHIPVMLISKDSSIETKLAAAEAKVDAFLEGSPLNFELFVLLLKNLLETVKAQRLWLGENYIQETRQLTSGKKDEAFLDSLKRIVNTNIDNSNLDINFVCREMGISRTNLYTKVKTVTGMGMVVFIRENRLNLAAKLLTENDMQTNEVMSMVGIHSHSYFSKAFKKKFGVSPSSFGDFEVK